MIFGYVVSVGRIPQNPSFRPRVATRATWYQQNIKKRNYSELGDEEEKQAGGEFLKIIGENTHAPIHMTTLIKQFIEAERSGNWDLHITTVQQMLPFFHAADHFFYAKCAYLHYMPKSIRTLADFHIF
ncbi:hypothetical protein AVEN_253137-1 [Araneus ventricosus]|uniref:Uncharacterized protein n=1 Tax=Araneus ventricosus TaxID=182803 RepID=A0A4Y2TNQ8_ARAVE|nr:hypothetical protein AVEN_253137-1 [Araneus ventricosus]